MKIIFWGTPEYCVPIFDSIIDSGHEIIAVVTQPDKRRGRGKDLSPSPIKKKAIEFSIPYMTPINIKTDLSVQTELKNYKADLYVVVAFGQILPKEILELPPLGCWNLHASLLPRWRGAAPIQWSLISGDKETGVAVMLMEEGLDTGPILIEKKVNIIPLVNASSLKNQLSLASSKVILEALEIIKDKKLSNLELLEQEALNRNPSYARMIKKSDFLIDWNDSSLNIYRKIIGLYPNSFTYINGKRLKILEAIPCCREFIEFLPIKLSETEFQTKYKPGLMIKKLEDIGLVVSTGDNPIIITKAKLEGKGDVSNAKLVQQLEKHMRSSSQRLGK